jgi:outer membrane protein assembly factor BamB
MPRHDLRSLLLCSCLVAGLVPGCASTPEDKAPTSQGVSTIDHDAWGKLGYRLDWQGFPFAGTVANAKVTLLTPSATYVLVQEKNSNVSLLEPNTGARRWTVEFGNNLTKFVALNSDPTDPNHIFVSAESELFTVAASSGNIIDRARFDKVVNTAPVLTDGLAIYGTSVGEVIAHRPGTMLKAWGYGTSAAIDANPVKLADSIGVVNIRGDVLFFNAGGSIQGRNHILGTLSTNPVTNGSYLACASLDQSLWCFDARGALTWRLRRSAPLAIQPTALETAVVCELPDSGLTAVEFATGKILWSNKAVRGTVVASNKGHLLVWDGLTASILDAARGDLLTAVELPGVAQITTDQFDAGNLYAATAEGSVAKFRLRN